MLIPAVLLLVGFAVCASLPAQDEAPPTLRLGEQVQPIEYRADLTIVPDQDTFAGRIEIDLDVRQPRRTIWLNGATLTVKEATLQAGSRTLPATIRPGGTQFLGFQFAEPVAAGKATLRVTYQGTFSKTASAGLFSMKEGADPYVFSQFEPLDARRAFPCFDEPSYKVPWTLTLHVRREHAAVSNQPVASEANEPDGMKVVRFKKTLPLPSYLVALAVGPFEFVDAGRAGRANVPVRIITPKGKAAQAKYAVEVTGPILNRLETYFGIPYPYEKLDSIAIPLTFGFGAMENAGLVTYASSLLLSEPAQDTITRQRNYANVCAHELAHQWFGNLVTMAWWDDTWLNEAFATWMASKLIREWKPEWNTVVNETVSRLNVMEEDSLISARQIRQPIRTDDDIANAFDGITYQKGAAVIRMFENWMGDASFRQGVQSYLKRYALRNAATGDFLDSLSSASQRNVTRAFSTFLTQAGVPLVTVDVSCPSGQTPTLRLSQRRSLPLGSPGAATQTWEVPVTVRYDVNGQAQTETVTLAQAEASFPLTKATGCPTAVVANAGSLGYHRTAYHGDLLARLLERNAGTLTVAERVSLLGDAEALMESGAMPARDALALAARFAADPERQVVARTSGILVGIKAHLVPPDLRANHARLIQKLYGERARQLGWTARPGDDAETRLLRTTLVPLVANHGEDAALAAAARPLAEKLLKDPSAVDPDMVAGVLTTAARRGDAALWETIRVAARQNTDRRQRGQLLNALGAFRDPALIRKSHALLLSGEFDIREALGLLFGSYSDDAALRGLPFAFLQENFEPLVKSMPTGTSFDLGAVLPNVGYAFCTAQDKAAVESFFRPRMARFTGGPRNLDKVLESITLCAAKAQAQQGSVAEFLKGF